MTRARMNTDLFGAPTKRAAPLQLDLFRVQVAPCGRSSAPTCELEHKPPAGCWTCLRCGCSAPVTAKVVKRWKKRLDNRLRALSIDELPKKGMPADGHSSADQTSKVQN